MRLLVSIDRKQLLQIGRFAGVGMVNTGIFAFIVWYLVGQQDISQTLANVAAFLVANVVSFFLHSIVTFKVAVETKKYLKFTASGIAALVAVIATGLIGDVYSLDYRVTFLLTVCLVPFATYFVLRFWVFEETDLPN